MGLPLSSLAIDARVQNRGRLPHHLGNEDLPMVLVDQRPAGKIAVHDHFENVVVQSRQGEIPVAFVRLIEEIQAVLALHPPDLDLHIHLFRIVVHAVALFGVHELAHGNGVAVRHDTPVVGIPVDARLHAGGELEYLERHILPLERGGRDTQERYEEGAYRSAWSHVSSSVQDFSSATISAARARAFSSAPGSRLMAPTRAWPPPP